MLSTRSYLAGAALGVVFVAFASWLVTGSHGPLSVKVVSNLGSLLACGFAVSCTALATRSSRGRQRWAWGAMVVALLGWFFGDTVWAYYDVVSTRAAAPFPSIGDAGYLLFPVAACIALVLMPIGGVGQSQIRLLLDGLIVATSLFVIFWVCGLDEVFTGGTEGRFAFAVSLAYPISDLVLLTVALVLLTRARPEQRVMIMVLTMAIAVVAISDAAFVVASADDAYVSGSLIDIGWVAGVLLLGCAAFIGLRSGDLEIGRPRAPTGMALWLPYLPLLPATVCLVYGNGSIPLLVGALLLVSAILARQFIVASENRRLLVQVAEQALRDPLTGLANRALFQDRLTRAMTLQGRDAGHVAMLSVDLDDFKLINDSLGHPAGDALLQAAAKRLLECVRSSDTVARLGGDEFAVLIEGCPDSPLIVAHRISDAFDVPFTVDGHDVYMRPSVGVAAGTANGDPEDCAEVLLKQADLAMYAAKRSQHGGVHPFTDDMSLIDLREVDPPQERSIGSRRPGSAGLQLFAQLRRAIDDGELSLVYQPKFTVSTGHVAGVEALVRWEHPQRGLMLPGDFLPLARQNGLMGALTEAVLDRAVRDAAEWRTRGVAMPFAINLFPPSLVDLELPGRITRILAEGGLTTDCLTVEITEDFLLGSLTRVRQVLDTLRENRIRISIDDFGTGYSALSYLRDLPIDELKIDRRFVAPILEDERADAIVQAMIDLTQRLGMTCVAEGVENAATAARLAEHGCDVIQGHYCSQPVGASRVLDVGPLTPLLGSLSGQRKRARPTNSPARGRAR